MLTAFTDGQACPPVLEIIYLPGPSWRPGIFAVNSSGKVSEKNPD
jgi:hypothetical protein